ncbi:oligopeptide/dipeptide ABC transporter ATP-binding protein [Pseudonocardia sp. GCM10023141]|uniref:oligopeptide/dipeptide ABC transporter ATP-binding protein n=1 Tax=Pseudonocardia sp. GCM10023141 TaxID=3252653 RepID=UPI0036113325
MTGPPLLRVHDLRVGFESEPAAVVLDGLCLEVAAGQVAGLVGEAGSGKTVAALALLRLLPSRGVLATGSVAFDGVVLHGPDLLAPGGPQRSGRRGRDIALLAGDPVRALHPIIPVGPQLAAALRRRHGLDRSAARRAALELIAKVGVADPRALFDTCPHVLPAGTRHRVALAAAMAGRPRLLVADEPTAGLDPTVAAQILALLGELVRETGAALLLCTSDIGIAAGTCETVNVLFGGRIVEGAGRHRLFGTPRHPYTHGLLRATPRLDTPPGELVALRGDPAANRRWDGGCAFVDRCGRAVDPCRSATPAADVSGGRLLRCHNPVPASAE